VDEDRDGAGKPELGADQVRVQVRTCAINRAIIAGNVCGDSEAAPAVVVDGEFPSVLVGMHGKRLRRYARRKADLAQILMHVRIATKQLDRVLGFGRTGDEP